MEPLPQLYYNISTGTSFGVAKVSAAAFQRHSVPESPAAPSPSHSHSGSSEDQSSRRSNRDSGRGVVSPSHLHRGSQRASSRERSPTSPVHKSAYEQMLNGTKNCGRKVPNVQIQPVVNGSMRLEKQSSPSGVTRRVVSTLGQQMSPPAVGREQPTVPSPSQGQESLSPSKYVRKPHRYDYVRFPHGYEEVDFPSQGQSQLSQGSTKSEARISRVTRKSGSEKRSNIHLSDSRLNKVTRRRASDKSFSTRRSPAASKRFSTGDFMMDESEARRLRENSAAFVKAKYRVSNPEPSSHQLHHDISMTGSGASRGTLAEEELAQDDVVFFVDDERVREELSVNWSAQWNLLCMCLWNTCWHAEISQDLSV